MRHGRKSSSRLIDGYKRHIMHDLDSAGAGGTLAARGNAPEAGVTTVRDYGGLGRATDRPAGSISASL